MTPYFFLPFSRVRDFCLRICRKADIGQKYPVTARAKADTRSALDSLSKITRPNVWPRTHLKTSSTNSTGEAGLSPYRGVL